LIARELILQLDHVEEIRMLSDVERAFRNDLKKLTLGLASLERTIARQRSRILYLSEGDANTRFFHLQANGRRRRRFITKLQSDDGLIYGHDEMADVLTVSWGSSWTERTR
jgi:hypothetical protein